MGDNLQSIFPEVGCRAKGGRMDYQLHSTTHASITKTIFKADLDETLVLAMVEYDDGRLGILRNGTAIEAEPWPTSELVECVDTFQRLAHQHIASRHGRQRAS
jgi:hypothetical protein